MANDLTLLKSFVDGQGAGASTYVTYAEDHDSNYASIESTFNTLNTEFKAFGGQNASLIFDLTTTATLVTGFIGIDSFGTVVFTVGDTVIEISTGAALTGDGRVESTSSFTLTGSGASGTRWFALSATGVITQETSANQGVIDLYSITWNGASFDTGTLARLPSTDVDDLIVDADDLQAARVQEDIGQGTDAVLGAFTYDQIAARLSDIVRIMGGVFTSSQATANPGGNAQATLQPMAFQGTSAAPGFIVGNGTDYNPLSGLFASPNATPGSESWGCAINGDDAITFFSVSGDPQARFAEHTTLAAPAGSFVGDPNTGFGWIAADEWRAIAGALEVARFFNDSGNVGLGVEAGDAPNPGLVLTGDRDTGMYGTGTANQLAWATGGVQALLLNQVRQVTGAAQFRVATTDASFAITNAGTLQNIDLTTEVFDVGTMHDNITNPDQHVVPTNGDGRYLIIGEVEFPDPGTPDGFRHIAITIQGAVSREVRVSADPIAETILSCSIVRDLSAADVVRLQAAHNDTSGPLNVRSAFEMIRLV